MVNDDIGSAGFDALLQDFMENPEECIVMSPEELAAKATKSEKIA